MPSRRFQKLEEDLKSADEEICRAAIEDLAKSRHAYALDLLFAKSHESNGELNELASAAFQKSVLASPKVALRHTSLMLRHDAARLLGESKQTGAIPELVRMASDEPDEVMRRVCLEALGAIGTRECVEGLRAGMLKLSLPMRRLVFSSLQKINVPEAEAALVDLLSDNSWELRIEVKEHLERCGWEPTTHRERVLWGIVLGRFDEAVGHVDASVDPLVDAALHVDNSDVRHWATIALTKLRGYDVRPQLRTAQRSSNEDVRRAATAALAVLGDAPFSVAETGNPWKQPKAARRKPDHSRFFHAAVRMIALVGEP